MLRRTGCAISAVLAAPLVLALVAGAPAAAQTTSAEAAAQAPSAAPQQAAAAPPARATPAAADSPRLRPRQPRPSRLPPHRRLHPPPARNPTPPRRIGGRRPTASPAAPPAAAEPPPPATPAVAEQPPPPPVDPVLAEVRRQLAEPAKGNVDRQDRAALAAFYAARNEPLLWVTGDGFTAKAKHAMAEIRKADDWGLSASAFELPQLAPGTAAPDALAGAEIKLGLAALKYARHARGGRLDPAQISKDIDVKLSLRDPKVVLEAMAATETPGNYSARPQSQARAVPEAAPGPAEGAQRPRQPRSR